MKGMIGILLITVVGLLSVFSSQRIICDTMPLKTDGVVIEVTSNKKAGNGNTVSKPHKLISLKHSSDEFQATEHLNSLTQNSFRVTVHNLQRWKKTIVKGLIKTDEQRTAVSRNEIHDSFYQGRTKRAAIYVYAIRQLLI